MQGPFSAVTFHCYGGKAVTLHRRGIPCSSASLHIHILRFYADLLL